MGARCEDRSGHSSPTPQPSPGVPVMLRSNILRALLVTLGASACGAATTEAPVNRVVRYSGTISQPAGPGFIVYKLSGAWTLDDKGALISGTDTTQIIDLTVYGVPGKATIVLKTKCVAIAGKDAW